MKGSRHLECGQTAQCANTSVTQALAEGGCRRCSWKVYAVRKFEMEKREIYEEIQNQNLFSSYTSRFFAISSSKFPEGVEI